MKIITKDAAYVQKCDLIYLFSSKISIPDSIKERMVEIYTSYEDKQFVKFVNIIEINFFNHLDWIIDYNKVKVLPINKLNEYGEQLINKKNEMLTTFNNMGPISQRNNLHLVTQADLLYYKACSLVDIIWLKNGDTTLELPEELKNKRKVL